MRLLPALLLSAAVAGAAPVELFNGRDLNGWSQEGARPSFYVEKGSILTSGRGQNGVFLRTNREFEDFRLTFDYKLEQWAEAAVILRAPRTDRPQHAGLTLVLAHDFHNEITPWVTGAVMGVRAPEREIKETWGNWKHVEIELIGDRFKASIDGVAVQQLSLSAVPELRGRLKRGFIMFPDMGYAYALRNLQVEELGAPTRYVELLAKGSIEDWTLRGGGNWRVTGGDTIEGSNGHGILYAPAVAGNFELTAVVRSHGRANAGVFLRGDPERSDGAGRGFEVQIYSRVDAVYPTGSIYGVARSRISADYEERWFLLQVRVSGKTCEVRIDGEVVAATDALPERFPVKGRIGLQIHKEDSRVEFRDLRVRMM